MSFAFVKIFEKPCTLLAHCETHQRFKNTQNLGFFDTVLIGPEPFVFETFVSL